MDETSSQKRILRKRPLQSLVWFVVFWLPVLWFGSWIWSSFYESVRNQYVMLYWDEVSAVITDARLEKQKKDPGDISDQPVMVERLAIKYRYFYRGRSYSGDKYSRYGDYESPNGQHQSLYGQMIFKQGTGEMVPCYVNPEKPTQAYLDRNIGWGGLTFGFIFHCIPTVVMLFVWNKLFGRIRSGYLTGKLSQEYPDEPWRWRPDWSVGVVRSPLPRVNRYVVIGSLIGLVVIVLMTLAGTGSMGVSWVRFFVVGLAAAVPLVVMGSMLVHRLKYSVSICELVQNPGIIGKELIAKVHCKRSLSSAKSFTLTLTCWKRVRVSNGPGERGHSTRHTKVWSQREFVKQDAVEKTRAGSCIPVHILLPDGLQSSSTKHEDVYYYWRLRVEGKSPEVISYREEFEVPVFDVALESYAPPEVFKVTVESIPAEETEGDSKSEESSDEPFGWKMPLFLSVVFVAIGVGVLWLTQIGPWREARVLESWVEVPARITQLNIDRKTYTEGSTRHSSGRRETYYDARVSYEYEYQGESYVGNRVAVYYSSPNDYYWKSRRAKQLKKNHEAGRAVTCYVNPENPGEAVLYNKVYRHGGVMIYIFCGLFVLMGVGMGAGSVYCYRARRNYVSEQERLVNDDEYFQEMLEASRPEHLKGE